MENRYKRRLNAKKQKQDGYTPIDFEKEQRRTLFIHIMGTVSVLIIFGLILISIFVDNAYYSIVLMLTYLLGFISKEMVGFFKKKDFN
ncbi:MAG: hypothetical protein V3V00_12955 [Saprospiraceae bacterium]